MERANDDHSRKKEFKGVDSLIEFDPSPRQEYLDWLCRAYVSQSFLLEDISRVQNTLAVFHRYKHRLPVEQRDIGRAKSEQELWDIVEKFTPNNGHEEEAGGKELKRREKAKAINESDILEASDLDGWIVASPKTHFAAKWWSKGTRWCTGMASKNYFNSYMDKGPLRIFISPDGIKYQAHVATLSFCDASDRRVADSVFIDKIPAPAIRMLQNDAIQSLDYNALFQGLPAALRTENMIAEARKKGLHKIEVLADNKDGYQLKLVPSHISMWALGLIKENEFKSPQKADIVLTNGHNIIARFYENDKSKGELFSALKKTNDIQFIKSCALALIKTWENHKLFKSLDFINNIGENLACDYFDEHIWDAFFFQCAKKPRENFTKKLLATEQNVTPDTANLLAKHNLLSMLPKSFITSERVNTHIAATPENIRRVTNMGYGHFITDYAILTAAKWKKGQGFKFIPYERLSEKLVADVITEQPAAIYHAHEDFLTSDIINYAVDRLPSVINKLGQRFITEELVMRAISKNGSIFQVIDKKYKTPAVTALALSVAPNVFIHTDVPLTYEQFKNGVALSGTALARVPLIYRTVEMCEAALSANVADAVSHVPPRVLSIIRERLKNNEVEIWSSNVSNWDKPLSKRYASDDPIHAFIPKDDMVMPERLKRLKFGNILFGRKTDPDGLLKGQNTDACMNT